MSRRYIGLSPRGMTVLRNVRRDIGGEPLVLLDESEAGALEIDFTGYLEAGETITAAEIVRTAGVTASIANTTSAVTLSLSNATDRVLGEVEVKATTSAGTIWRRSIHVRQTNRKGDEAYVLPGTESYYL